MKISLKQKYLFQINDFGLLDTERLTKQNVIMQYLATHCDKNFISAFSVQGLVNYTERLHKQGAEWSVSGQIIPELSVKDVINGIEQLLKINSLEPL